MTKNLYDVTIYETGEPIMTRCSCKEISEKMGFASKTIYKAASNGNLLGNKYQVDKVGESDDLDMILLEWEATTAWIRRLLQVQPERRKIYLVCGRDA